MKITYSSEKTHFVELEGNVGSGKTSVLRIMKGHLFSRINGEEIPYVSIPEETPDCFKEYMDTLTTFYETEEIPKNKKILFEVQMEFLEAKYIMRKEVVEQLVYSNVASERSPHADSLIFFQHLVDLGLVDDRDANLYFNRYEKITKELLDPSELSIREPDQMAYLLTKPQTAFQRVKDRGREGEEKITLIRTLLFNGLYNQWYDAFDYSPKIKIPFDEPNIIKNPEDVRTVLEQIVAGLILNSPGTSLFLENSNS